MSIARYEEPACEPAVFVGAVVRYGMKPQLKWLPYLKQWHCWSQEKLGEQPYRFCLSIGGGEIGIG